MERFKAWVPLYIVAASLLAACGGGGGSTSLPTAGSSNGGTSPTEPSTGGPAVVRMKCSDVSTASLGISGLIVDSSTTIPSKDGAGSAAYPPHCYVTGRVNARTGADGKAYAIGVDLRLPDASWNGKFFYSGDGGLDGALSGVDGQAALGGNANALQLGYAVASSDGGHRSASLDGSFGLDPQARIDYGYNALGTWAPLAKKIVAKFYGQELSRSYYVGCSKGGQSGMQAAARFADEFDGILAGDPGFNLPKSGVEAMFDNQQLATVNTDITKAFSTADLALVSSSILAKCDALDGASDGIVNDLPGCKAAFDFTADVPQCPTGVSNPGACLSSIQKTALAAIMNGARAPSGALLYSDWPWDPGIASSDWVGWKTFLNVALSPVATANVFATPPTPGVSAFSPAADTYWRTFDVNQGYELIYGTSGIFSTSSMDFMLPPDMLKLSTLKRKSKLLVYHGAADGIFSVNDTIDWYSKLSASDSAASTYARLFVVPGMGHCGGGQATDRFDAFSSLVNWVEKGEAPERIVATVSPTNADKPASWPANRSRPLCSYPKKAVLKSGGTDLESADGFVCQ